MTIYFSPTELIPPEYLYYYKKYSFKRQRHICRRLKTTDFENLQAIANINEIGGGCRFFDDLAAIDSREQEQKQLLHEENLPIHSICYGGIRGRNPQTAIVDLQQGLLPRNCSTIARIDIFKCFDSINLEHLEETLSPHFQDQQLLATLIDEHQRSFLFDNSIEETYDGYALGSGYGIGQVHTGLKTGHRTSPILLNAYFYRLHQFLYELSPYTVGYMDDYAIPCRSKAEAREFIAQTRAFLQEHYPGLELSRNKSIGCHLGQPIMEFLGYSFGQNGQIILSETRWLKAEEFVRSFATRWQPNLTPTEHNQKILQYLNLLRNELSVCPQQYAEHIQAEFCQLVYNQWANHYPTTSLRRNYLNALGYPSKNISKLLFKRHGEFAKSIQNVKGIVDVIAYCRKEVRSSS